jgi:ABC-type glycerol-3-phosphate transport system substrate-binding protein
MRWIQGVGLLALMAAAACAPLGRPAYLLVLWHALDPERGAALARLTEAYMAQYPDVAIYIETFPSSSELLRRLRQPSERGPDVVLIPPEAAPALVQAGQLTPLMPWVEDPVHGLSAAERQDLLPPTTVGSLPFLREGLLLYADADRLLESGLEQPVGDWEAIRQVCLRGALDLDGDGMPDTAGWMAPRAAWTLQGWLARRSEPEARALLEAVQGMLRLGCARLADPPQALRAFLEGETVLLFGSSYWLFTLERESEAGRLRFRLALAPLLDPQMPGRPLVPGWGWDLAIAAMDPGRQAAAWSFLRWTLDVEVQARWAREAQALPVRRTAAARLQQLAGPNSLLSQLMKWVLEGYREEPADQRPAAPRLEEALRLLEGGTAVSVLLDQLRSP